MAEGEQRGVVNGEWTARLVNLIFEKRQTGVNTRYANPPPSLQLAACDLLNKNFKLPIKLANNFQLKFHLWQR